MQCFVETREDVAVQDHVAELEVELDAEHHAVVDDSGAGLGGVGLEPFLPVRALVVGADPTVGVCDAQPEARSVVAGEIARSEA